MKPTATQISRPYTDAYLLEYSHEHVFYEVDMFMWLAQVCGGGAKIGAASPADTTRVSNVLIESFVVHLRNVVDFLFLDEPQRTDIVAADFCADGAWHSVRPAISPVLKKARIRAHKEIAHLTSDRLPGSSPEKQWKFRELAAEVQPILRLFSKIALDGRLSDRVRVRIG